MEITEPKAPPAPPNIITALRSGFDAIANRVYLIMIPIMLDLWLWLGPHIQIKSIMTSFMDSMRAMPEFASSSSSGGLLPTDPATYQTIIERVNLMTILRSYPVGIPSLVSGFLPLKTPIGSPVFYEVTSPVAILLIWLGFSLLGILVGSIYFIIIAQAAVNRQMHWKKAIKEWPQSMVQAVLLSVTVGLLLIVLMVPSTCILSIITMGGIPVNQIVLIVIIGMLLWVLFPLMFTPHGIFLRRVNILAAIQRSIIMTRMTMPTTALFILIVLVTSQGLDILWRVPDEKSWLTLIGLAGHGFVASALLAASFVYYRDADAWVQNILRKMSLSGTIKT